MNAQPDENSLSEAEIEGRIQNANTLSPTLLLNEFYRALATSSLHARTIPTVANLHIEAFRLMYRALDGSESERAEVFEDFCELAPVINASVRVEPFDKDEPFTEEDRSRLLTLIGELGAMG